MKKMILTLAATFTLGVAHAFADTPTPPAVPTATPEVAAPTPAKPADSGDWRSMIKRVKQLKNDTGIAGFMKKEPPEYLAKGYMTPTGAMVPGHDVKIIFNIPYGTGQALMILICLVLLYLAIVKEFEPLLLLPIGFGGLLSNLPFANVAAPPLVDAATRLVLEPGGFLYYFFEFGINTGVFPIVIFMGVGAMTDFGPLIANPRTALLGAAAQFGIFVALLGALGMSMAFPEQIHFGLKEASSIGIIGGADGPTAIWLTTKLAPHLLGAIAVAAYSYMALVPIIQPPIMRLLVPERERKIVMKQLRPVSKMEKVCFPLIVLLLCALLLPSSVPLIGAVMLGNLCREVGPSVARLADTMANALINIVTIMLGLAVGSKLACEKFLNPETLGILVLGLFAFGFGTAVAASWDDS